MLVFARAVIHKDAPRWTDFHSVIKVHWRSNDADAAIAHRFGESLTSSEEFVLGVGML